MLLESRVRFAMSLYDPSHLAQHRSLPLLGMFLLSTGGIVCLPESVGMAGGLECVVSAPAGVWKGRAAAG